MKKLVIALNLVSLFTLAQIKTRSYIIDPKLDPREHNVDFKHLRLELEFEPSKGQVKGVVTHRFTPLRQQVDSIVLDAINMKVSEVTLNGKTVKYNNDSSFITIFPATPLKWETTDSITIHYTCTPRKGLYFVGWNDPNTICRKQIWSQGQGIDNRNWIPMYDEMNDKVVSELIVKFDKQFKVLSNGKLLGKKENKDGTLSWHYSMIHPHAPYLIMLGVGNYDIKETKSKSGLPMHLYYYPDWKDRVEATYKYSERMVDFFEKEIGVPFGWTSYSQLPVQEFMFGAMENTSATVYGDFFCVDNRSFLDRNYIGVNSHELAHQWFGDLVTARSDAHHWLQESFATYYSQLFDREVFGENYFEWERRNAQNSSLAESKKNNLPVAHSESGTARHYPKGAFVLNMLKYVLGSREEYNKAIKKYVERHKYDNVDSEDLLTAFHESTGLSLDWFWEEWIYKGGEPDYNVTFKETNDALRFTVTQTQETSEVIGLPTQGTNRAGGSNDPFVASPQNKYRQEGLFKMPIVFEVYYTDGTMDKKMVVIEQQTESVTFLNPSHKKVDYVLFDPNNNVLKSCEFNKSFDMLQAQAQKTNYMLDRYDAVVAMRKFSADAKRDLLLGLYEKETFHAIKSEIVYQLANDANPKSIALVKKAITDKDVMVRKTALREVSSPAPEIVTELEKLLKDSSYEIIEDALEKLVHINPSGTSTYLDACKNVEGTSGRNVITRWLEISYMNTGDKQFADKLVAYTSNSYEFRTRVNAMNALKRSNYFDMKMVDNMLNALFSGNGRLAGPANETLNYFYNQDKYKETISNFILSKNLTDWQYKKAARYIYNP